jgi:cell division transport system permease protein
VREVDGIRIEMVESVDEAILEELPKASLPVDPWAWCGYPFLAAWQSFRVSPFTALSTLAITSVVLSLSMLLLLVLENVQDLLLTGKSKIQLSIYLQDGITQRDSDELIRLLKADSAVVSVTERSKEEAMTIFRQELGSFSFVLDGFEEENPLPASLEVDFNAEVIHRGLLETYREKFSGIKGVEFVQYDRTFADKLGSLVKYVRGVVALLVPLLLGTVGFVIWITSRLAIHSHRREIEVKRLVGAPAWYIWSPFATEGAILGLTGAMVSLLATYCITSACVSFLQSDVLLSSIFPPIRFLSQGSILLVVFLSGLVGAFSGYLAAGVHRFR